MLNPDLSVLNRMVNPGAAPWNTELPIDAGAFPRKVATDRLVQDPNALEPISVTLDGIVMETRFGHEAKAQIPIRVTPVGGMLTVVSPVHPSNAESPISVTLAGIVTVARFRHDENAPLPIKVTFGGMTTLVRELHPSNA